MIGERDAIQLYADSIVEYNGRLAFVREVVNTEEGVRLALKYPGSRGNVLVAPNPDEVLCPSLPYRLGYLQYTAGRARYLSRTPRRQYTAGWSSHNVNGLDIPLALKAGTTVVDNLMGVFPTFQEAIAQSVEHGGNVAFDRMFAVGSGGKHLEYKGSAIAIINGEDADLEDRGMGHLRELFNKAKERQNG